MDLSRLSPALITVLRSVHVRLSSGKPVSNVRTGPLTLAEREALADLLGLARLPTERPTVTIAALDAALLDAVGATSREVVSAVVGPVGDRAGARLRDRTERARLWEWLAGHPVVRAQPALNVWVAAVRRTGIVGGAAARTRDGLDDALRVLAALPATGEPLPVFADAVLHDTHALDDGTSRGGQVLRALAAIYRVPPPADAAARRALWARAGIADDELSSTVLAAGLRIGGEHVVGQVLHVCADAGHAAVVSLAQLRGSAAPGTGPERVWVVENPSVLALALRRFGPACPPVICTAGWPSTAAMLLLRMLRDVGTEIHYHGDFDGEGLRIAAYIAAGADARPWRMRSADYLAAVGDGPPVGAVDEVPWDPDLAGHLITTGTTVPEERVAPILLDDLARHAVG